MADAIYELRLRGPVSSRTLAMFEEELDLRCDTLVSGGIQDQAALHGVLERIRDLGLEIIDVHQVTDQHADARRAPSSPSPATEHSSEPHPT